MTMGPVQVEWSMVHAGISTLARIHLFEVDALSFQRCTQATCLRRIRKHHMHTIAEFYNFAYEYCGVR